MLRLIAGVLSWCSATKWAVSNVSNLPLSASGTLSFKAHQLLVDSKLDCDISSFQLFDCHCAASKVFQLKPSVPGEVFIVWRFGNCPKKTRQYEPTILTKPYNISASCSPLMDTAGIVSCSSLVLDPSRHHWNYHLNSPLPHDGMVHSGTTCFWKHLLWVQDGTLCVQHVVGASCYIVRFFEHLTCWFFLLWQIVGLYLVGYLTDALNCPLSFVISTTGPAAAWLTTISTIRQGPALHVDQSPP